MKIAIIGAGIGGLTTALFLMEQGIDVHIFEQSPEIKPVGAGIILAHNAMQVFDKLGLNRSIAELGKQLRSLNIKTSVLGDINEIDTRYFDQKFSVNCVAIKRSSLQDLLIKSLASKQIYLNKKVTDIKSGEKTSIYFSDGSEFTCDALISADGIHSVTRNTLFKTSQIRKPQQMCWRGISSTHLPQDFKHELNELWGKGSRFGFVEVSEHQVYWYALHNTGNHKNLTKKELLHSFGEYADIVGQIISDTQEDNIHQSEIADLKPIPSWHQKSTCLLGDAAHATTPNMGQGACQAIEDAYALSYYIEKYPIDLAFRKFEQSRKSKAQMVVKMSWYLGFISQIESPILSSLRNFLLRNSPKKYNLKQTEKIYSLPQLQ